MHITELDAKARSAMFLYCDPPSATEKDAEMRIMRIIVNGFLLAKEIARHHDDVAQINRDLSNLEPLRSDDRYAAPRELFYFLISEKARHITAIETLDNNLRYCCKTQKGIDQAIRHLLETANEWITTD